ncbi:arabinose-5-phosphate isomerase [Bauldia litoralis]|uniref:Arabinose-5-phosphate isomerase n=1 Tax=Bauldia litoralis TaxID=665467 RepID=A0A1G6A530_9HYPH|nr:arabinose-5-phosphate isomerase [Bauldia litoralis]
MATATGRRIGETAVSRSDSGAAGSARRTIETERAGLVALLTALDNGLSAPFGQAVDLIRDGRGRVVVTGLGKSGHVARKVAATLASTGTPAFFVHPSEASHGDLGMITRDDVVLAMSWSGETAELRGIVEYSRRFHIPLIALTATEDSSLARESAIVLLMPQVNEACPHGLAPTTSAMIQLALGDALAIALLESRGFTAESFHAFHPGGKLGANLKFVRDIMHRGNALPLASIGTEMSEAIVRTTEKGFGCLGIVGEDGRLIGIVTDGDLRRHLGPDLLTRRVEEVMTKAPKTVPPEILVGAAIDTLNQAAITAVFVVEDGRPVGIVHMHDLLRIGVV